MSERRYERLHPAELREEHGRAPVAYVPLGTLEFHGEHLPFGVDSFEAHGLALRAAERSGGIVLPSVYLASGCLDLPFTLTYDPDLVFAWARSTVVQLARRGFRVVVVLTGHGPLDLNHLLKRACAEAEREAEGVAAYGLCWLELNAARLEGPEEGEPTIVDHAALVETSWMLALEPGLVRLERLSDDPDAKEPGVYGRNPRHTASAAFGERQLDAAADLLAERVRALLDGCRFDAMEDLRRFVRFSWPESLRLTGAQSTRAATTLRIRNPGRASRYISSLDRLELDGEAVDLADVTLVNPSPGETGLPVSAASLAPERGWYLRRGQEATIRVGTATDPGIHRVRLTIGLGGVDRAELDEVVETSAG